MQHHDLISSPAKSSPVCLMERFVDEVLNRCSSPSISEIFSPSFRDHDPLRVFGLLEPEFLGWGTRRDIHSLLELLSQPSVDFFFQLVDAFSVEDMIGYRLFGQGTIRLDVSTSSPPTGSPKRKVSANGRTVRRLDLRETSVMVTAEGWADEGKVVGNQFDVTYSCVGIFRKVGQQLAERWGRAYLE